MTRNPIVAPPPRYHAADFPKVDRSMKGDRLVVAPPEPAETESPPARAGDRGSLDIERFGRRRQDRRGYAVSGTCAARSRTQAALSAPPLPQYDVSMSLEPKPRDGFKTGRRSAEAALAPAPPRDGFSFKTSSLFFGSSLGSPESIERWRPGEEPVW